MPILGNQGGGTIPPEQIVTGTGSYTIPAGKYGLLSMSVASAGTGYSWSAGFNNMTFNGSGSGGSNANQQWVPEGTNITVFQNNGGGTTSGSNPTRISGALSAIYLNGTAACVAYSAASAGAQDNSNGGQARATTGHYNSGAWSVSIYSN